MILSLQLHKEHGTMVLVLVEALRDTSSASRWCAATIQRLGFFRLAAADQLNKGK